MFSNEFLRVIIEEREREVQQRLRMRRLIGPHEPILRWFDRGRRQPQGSKPSSRGR